MLVVILLVFIEPRIKEFNQKGSNIMKNVIVVADWFMGKDKTNEFLEFITVFQDSIHSIYYDGDFYNVQNTLKNFMGN